MRSLQIYALLAALWGLSTPVEARQISTDWGYTLDGCAIGGAARGAADADGLGPPPAQRSPWPTSVAPGDQEGLLTYLRGEGWLEARIVDAPDERLVCVVAGTRYLVVPSFLGVGPADSAMVLPAIPPSLLDSLATARLEGLERSGRIRSRVAVEAFRLKSDSILIDLGITPGRQAQLLGLLVGGGTRTSIPYLQRVTGLREGMELAEFNADALRRGLMDTGLFQRVERPVLLPTSDSTAIVQLVLQDRAPGSFDLALGYLPGGAGRAGSIVGSGNLILRNLFGGGRSFSVELDRLPGQTSSLEVAIADPFVLGRNLGVDASFEGYQQDSTFSRQEYGISTGLRLGQTVLRARVTRRVSHPGTSGAQIVDGFQRAASASTRMAGFGIVYRNTDDLFAPSKGIAAEVEVLRGRQQRERLEVTGPDTVRVSRSVLQDRLEGEVRGYLPLNRSLTLVLGGDARVLVSDAPDPSDLFRLGGTSTLRGYDEERFAGIAVGRVLAELRSRLEGPAFAYTFVDLGYVDPGKDSGEKPQLYPGFGVGVQLATAAGLLNVSYAVNREDGLLNGRIHFGIAFGL